MPNPLVTILKLTPVVEDEILTVDPKRAAARDNAPEVMRGDHPRRCPTGYHSLEQINSRIEAYSRRRTLADKANQFHTSKRMDQYINRLRQIKQEKFPQEDPLFLGCEHERRAFASTTGRDLIDELSRIENRINYLEKAHFNKDHGISIYTPQWARRITGTYLKNAKTELSRKGYKFHVKSGTPDDKYSQYEKTWNFTKDDSNKIAFAMLQDGSWVFDVFNNGVRTNYMVMNQSRTGQKSQGVPISMRSHQFSGVFSPSEARLYKSNWRRTLKWIYEL